MKKVNINLQIFKKWADEFIKINNKSPGLRDLYKYKGCPYNKDTILKEYGNLSNLYSILNLERKGAGYNNISDEELLKILKEYVLKFRTTDRDILRNNGLYDRSVYENRFKSWSKALKLAGINNSVKTLIKYFNNYNGENYIEFLKSTIGDGEDFTPEQKDIMTKASLVDYDKDKIRNSINYNYIKRNFITVSILLIACGEEPNVTYCSGNSYISKDNHKCDSSKEVTIDNFLYNNNINHSVHELYPNSNFKCDFKIKNIYIEYAGLTDKLNYKKDIERKIKFAKDNNINQIVIYDTDINTLNNLKAALLSDKY